MDDDVTAVIPSIPTRRESYLPLAIRSVLFQSHPVTALSVAVDTEKRGSWHTRQRALDSARTTWVAFLDDDDEWYADHVETLLRAALDNEADYVFSWFDTRRTHDYLGHFGKPFNPAAPHHTTMTVLVRTELAQSVRFTPRDPSHAVGGEDWRFTLGCVEAGATFLHVPVQTWYYRHHGDNTSGREDTW